ncbi:MAG: MCE family protein [Muribaculaceae bacterium]|nr:MCE family protein [Muribaculaceae bacterium]
MIKRVFTKEVIIGLCVAAAIMILCFGIEFLKGINVFKPANFYIAEYENVEGLEVAAPVTIDGYKVGQVREINFNYENPGKIQVLLALNKQLHLPVDSRALIGSTLLSGSYVEIKLGNSKEMIPLGGEISSGMTPDLMSSLSSEVLPAVSSIMPKIDSLLLNINNLVADPSLVASLRNIETITSNISEVSRNLNLVMQRQVPSLLNGAGAAVTNLDTISANLKLLSEELNKLPLNQTMENVNGLTANLVTFTSNLNNPNSTLGELTQDSELYNKLNRLTADIDSLIIDIKKNPKRYISIKLL